MKISLILAVALVHSALAVAADAQPDVSACAYEAEPAARLACYDTKIPPKVAVTAAAPSSVAPPAAAAATAPTTTAASAAASGSTTAVPTRAAPESDFGLEEQRAREREVARVRDDDRISTRVASVSTRPRGELALKLENGQSWDQTERRPGSIVKPGEQVTISRGALGAFYLTSESRVTLKVKRVE